MMTTLKSQLTQTSLLAAVLLTSACASQNAALTHARTAAATQYSCNNTDVTVVENQDRATGTKGYWLDVCGKLRFYERAALPATRKLGALERQKMLADYQEKTTDIQEAQVPEPLRARWIATIQGTQPQDTTKTPIEEKIAEKPATDVPAEARGETVSTEKTTENK